MRIYHHDHPLRWARSRCPLTAVMGFLLIVLAPIAAFGQPPSSDYPSSDSSEYGEGYGEEMMDSPDGDGSYNGGPGGSTRGTGSASDAMMQSYAASVSSLLGSVDLNALLAPSSGTPMVDAGPVLSTEAEHAYQNGNYPLALELYYGHMVAEYEQASVSLQTVNYSQLLRRPVWQVRFGVSYALHRDVEADPQPIEEGKTPMNRMANSGDPSDTSSEPEMTQETIEPEMSSSYDDGSQTMRPSPAKSTAAMLNAAANEELEKYLGLVAKVVAEEFESRYRKGAFGPALITVTEPLPVDPRQRRGEQVPVASFLAPMSQEVMDALADSPEPRPLWKPGIMYYGEGESTDVLREAKREILDVLLHFDITLKTGRQEYVQNVSYCRLFDVASGKTLVSSKGIDNFEAIRLAQTQRNTEREYVTTQLENLFSVMDRSMKTTEFPKLTPEMAKGRVASLLSGSNAQSLRTLAEIRLYQVQGLVTEQEVEAAFDIIGGQDGLLLMHGPLEQRLAVARKWAVRAVPQVDR